MLEYAKAKEYMDAAISIQEHIIQTNLNPEDVQRETFENLADEDLESNMI